MEQKQQFIHTNESVDRKCNMNIVDEVVQSPGNNNSEPNRIDTLSIGFNSIKST